MTSLTVGEVDRFVVPVEDKRAVRFFLHHLFLPHNHREWVWSHVLRRSVWFPRGDGWLGDCRKLDARVMFAGELADWLPPDFASTLEIEVEELSWILLRGYPSSSSSKLLFFLFRPREREPFAVLKLGRGVARPAMESEWNALRHLHRRLPSELASTIPTPLGLVRRDGAEALLSSYVRGRTFDSDIARRPAPEKKVRAHFQSAASWLACFHITTRSGNELVLDHPRVRLPLSASHGDFWSRNVLGHSRTLPVGGPGLEVSGVVDWEQFSEEAPPYEDLFHFSLTYALNYPWSPYRRRTPADAFRLAFVEGTLLSRAIRGGLVTYCDLTGVPFESLGGLFTHYLRSPSAARYGLSGSVELEPSATFGDSC